MDLQACPLCGTLCLPIEKNREIYKCSNLHGKFEWFDRVRLRGQDPEDIFTSLPYSIQLQSDYKRMRKRYFNGFRKRVRRYFSKPDNISFLDVGCANGEYLSCAVELGMRKVMGVEIDKISSSRAMGIAPVVSDISAVNSSFDIIQCKNVIGNVLLFQDLLRQMLARLKPDGVLFLDVLNNYGLTSFFKRLRGRPGMLKPPYIINGFSKESLTWLVQETDAEVIKMDTDYCGSDMVPYRWKLRLFLSGQIAAAMQAGVMILMDIRSRT